MFSSALSSVITHWTSDSVHANFATTSKTRDPRRIELTFNLIFIHQRSTVERWKITARMTRKKKREKTVSQQNIICYSEAINVSWRSEASDRACSVTRQTVLRKLLMQASFESCARGISGANQFAKPSLRSLAIHLDCIVSAFFPVSGPSLSHSSFHRQ